MTDYRGLLDLEEEPGWEYGELLPLRVREGEVEFAWPRLLAEALLSGKRLRDSNFDTSTDQGLFDTLNVMTLASPGAIGVPRGALGAIGTRPGSLGRMNKTIDRQLELYRAEEARLRASGIPEHELAPWLQSYWSKISKDRDVEEHGDLTWADSREERYANEAVDGLRDVQAHYTRGDGAPMGRTLPPEIRKTILTVLDKADPSERMTNARLMQLMREAGQPIGQGYLYAQRREIRPLLDVFNSLPGGTGPAASAASRSSNDALLRANGYDPHVLRGNDRVRVLAALRKQSGGGR